MHRMLKKRTYKTNYNGNITISRNSAIAAPGLRCTNISVLIGNHVCFPDRLSGDAGSYFYT